MRALLECVEKRQLHFGAAVLWLHRFDVEELNERIRVRNRERI
ncbi:hypothetical protein [Natrinema gelatinilyticum]|nr:hypothetical protein [Natrinema gelatinilyticum]